MLACNGSVLYLPGHKAATADLPPSFLPAQLKDVASLSRRTFRLFKSLDHAHRMCLLLPTITDERAGLEAVLIDSVAMLEQVVWVSKRGGGRDGSGKRLLLVSASQLVPPLPPPHAPSPGSTGGSRNTKTTRQWASATHTNAPPSSSGTYGASASPTAAGRFWIR